MKLKKKDIKYLGVDKDKILIASPLINKERRDQYLHYITERENVYKKRLKGEAYPWTDDLIIRNNSFTNNHRFNDRYSKYVLKNIINDDSDLSNRIYKSLLSRIYNSEGFCELVNISNPDFWEEDIIKENVKKLENPEVRDKDIYTNAYRLIQPKCCYHKMYPENHYKSHGLLYIRDVRKQYGKAIVDFFKSINAQECYNWILSNIRGAGNFISYQMFVDISYFKEIPFSDRWFVVSGPGCTKGLKYLYDDWDNLNAEELLWWHKNHLEDILKEQYLITYNELFDNELEENRYFDLQECENSFCEYSKYIQLSEGRQGRIRRYKEENIRPLYL